MNNEKRKNLATINTLSKNTTCNNAIYTLYLHSKLQKSKEDIKNNKVMTIEESKERLKKKYANFNVQ